MSHVSEQRRGSVLVHVVICLGVLMAVAAIALDGGLLLDQRRRLQVAADAAALSAAADLYGNYLSNNGLDPKGTAKASALATAAAHGYANNGGSNNTASIVSVSIPPQTASFPGASKPGYAEVVIQYNQRPGFSGIFNSGHVPVRARAVARGLWTPDPTAVLLLHPRETGALTASGGGSLNVVGGPVVVDSNSPQAVVVNGGGTLTAPEFDLTGTPGVSGNTNGTVKAGVTATPNPFLYLPPPVLANFLLKASTATVITGTAPVTLSPGVYNGGISITGKGAVTLQPGTYYLRGGGFSYTGSGNLTANGVLLFNAPLSDGDVITLAGQGSVTMSPLTTGLYQGFSIVQDAYSTLPVTITGNGKMNITGTIYAAHARLNLTASAGTNVIGSQIVAYDLTLSGAGGVTVRRDLGPTGRVREISLVE